MCKLSDSLEKSWRTRKPPREETYKKTEFNLMLNHLESMIAKSTTDAKRTIARNAMRLRDNETAPEPYRHISYRHSLSNRWGMTKLLIQGS